MHLISTLCAGIAGASNGWAELYVRGTSTRATWYPNFEASTSNSSGANITLDAYGAVEVYVNQLVDVIVKSEDGTTVRSFTDGYASPNIEVISPSFTGNDYVSGASGVSKPTTLQAVLDRWDANAGAPDWKVNVGGTPTTMLDIAGALAGLVFNVKSPAYGATGDGVTNDQAAIQAAHLAAVTAGGGTVYFPKGTYRITSEIAWDNRVNILGAGADLSTISINSASNSRIIDVSTGSLREAPTTISGVSFAASQTNSGTQVRVSTPSNLLFSGVRFGASSLASGICLDVQGAGSLVACVDCSFTANGTVKTFETSAGSSGTASFSRCFFKSSSTTTYGNSLCLVGSPASFSDCYFDITTLTAGTGNYGIEMSGGHKLSVWGCKFASVAVLFTAGISLTANSLVHVDGCDFGSSTYYELASGILSNGSKLQLRADINNASSAAPTIPIAVESFMMVSTTTVPTFTMPTILFPGQPLNVLVRNNSGAGWGSMNFSGSVAMTNIGSYSIANSADGFVQFIASDLSVPGTYVWRAVLATI